MKKSDRARVHHGEKSDVLRVHHDKNSNGDSDRNWVRVHLRKKKKKQETG